MNGTAAAGLGTMVAAMLIAGCAPAPLYTAGGLHRGAATWGEIPRDSRGEPVWSAIRPVPVDSLTPPRTTTARIAPMAIQEGDADALPPPPRN